MSWLRVLVTGLVLALPAPAEEPDPEPPKPGPVSVRLVARKKTYRLNLGGMTAEKFRARVKAGGANLPEAPAVDLVLIIRNNTRGPIRVRTAGASNRVALNVTGPNVVAATVNEVPTPTRARYVALEPGMSTEVPIDRLVSKQAARRLIRHYWTEPGEYTLRASIYLLVGLDWVVDVRINNQYLTLKAPAVTVKVEK
jgi:hypothetical protein